jgi:hypothetical protein
MGNQGDGNVRLEFISEYNNNCKNELTNATDSVMALSSRGAGWVTEVIATFGLKLLVNVITDVRIMMSLPEQPSL